VSRTGPLSCQRLILHLSEAQIAAYDPVDGLFQILSVAVVCCGAICGALSAHARIALTKDSRASRHDRRTTTVKPAPARRGST
jgi:hypothetical protein